MMRNLKAQVIVPAVLFATLICFATQTLGSQIIYREIFPNGAASSDIATSNVDWYGNEIAVDGTIGAVPSNVKIGGHDNTDVKGSLRGLAPLNSYPEANSNYTGDNSITGIIYATSHSINARLFWTDEFSINQSAWSLTQITWLQNSGGSSSTGTNDALRAALRIDGNWYVSDVAYNDGDGTRLSVSDSNNKAFYELQLDLTSATWTSGLDLGTATTGLTLPGGTIDAFGLYQSTYDSVNTSLDTMRIDDFTIEATAVPEPSTLAFLAIGVYFMVMRRRYR